MPRAENAVRTLLAFGAGIVVSTVGTLTFLDGRIATASAVAAEARVGPVRQDLDAHLREVRSAGRYMHEYARWSSRTIYALCRANRDADCPPPPAGPGPIGAADRNE